MTKIVILLSGLFVLVTGFLRDEGREKRDAKQKMIGILYETGIVLLSAVLALFLTNADQDIQKKKQLRSFYSVLQTRSDTLFETVFNIVQDINKETKSVPEFESREWYDVDFFSPEDLVNMDVYFFSNTSWLKNHEDISFLYTDNALEYSDVNGLIQLQDVIFDIKNDVSYLEDCYYSRNEATPAVVHELYLLALKSIQMHELCQFEMDYLDNKKDIKLNHYSVDYLSEGDEKKDKFLWIESFFDATIPIGIDGDWGIRGYLEKYFNKKESEITWDDIKNFDYD